MTFTSSFFDIKIDAHFKVEVRESESSEVTVLYGDYFRFATRLVDAVDQSFVGYLFGTNYYRSLPSLVSDVVQDIIENSMDRPVHLKITESSRPDSSKGPLS